MVVDLKMPLYHIENKHLRKAFAIADPSLKIPSHISLSKDIDACYKENRTGLKEMLRTVDEIVATVDLWTSYRRCFYFFLHSTYFINQIFCSGPFWE